MCGILNLVCDTCVVYLILNHVFLGFNRLDDQVFVNKNQGIPTVIKFHPYEPYIAVADKESIRYSVILSV
jgi:hypothetical protein